MDARAIQWQCRYEKLHFPHERRTEAWEKQSYSNIIFSAQNSAWIFSMFSSLSQSRIKKGKISSFFIELRSFSLIDHCFLSNQLQPLLYFPLCALWWWTGTEIDHITYARTLRVNSFPYIFNWFLMIFTSPSFQCLFFPVVELWSLRIQGYVVISSFYTSGVRNMLLLYKA